MRFISCNDTHDVYKAHLEAHGGTTKDSLDILLDSIESKYLITKNFDVPGDVVGGHDSIKLTIIEFVDKIFAL